jgi:hypothetical protein
MGIASVRANDWPASGPDSAAAAPRAETAQQTEAAKARSDVIRTMEQLAQRLPDFLQGRCLEARNSVVKDLVSYDDCILGNPPYRKPAASGLSKKLLDDIRAQRDLISPETLKRLAEVKDMEGIRDELIRIRNEVDGLINGQSVPSRFAEHCLNLQIEILVARLRELPGPHNRSASNDASELLKSLRDGGILIKQLHDRARDLATAPK